MGQKEPAKNPTKTGKPSFEKHKYWESSLSAKEFGFLRGVEGEPGPTSNYYYRIPELRELGYLNFLIETTTVRMRGN